MALQSWGLCWANPLWEASVLSHGADKLLFLHCKASPQKCRDAFWRNHRLRSQMEFSLVCSVLVPFCHSVPPAQQDLDSPNCYGGDPSAYYWKSSSKCDTSSLLPFVCFLCFLPVPGVLEVCAVIVTLGQTSQANTSHTHTLRANQTSGI